jgi:hypothetical protein
MRQLLRSRLVLALAFILLTVSVIAVFAARQFQQIKGDIRVENKTDSLVIESVTKISKQNYLKPKKPAIRLTNNNSTVV